MKKVVALALALLLCVIIPAPSTHAESNTEGVNVMSALSDKQRNSIGVLNYLLYLTKEIETQKDNRLYLEKTYSSLYNNTYMNSIDEVTFGQVKSLLTALNNFKMLAVKRERLEYIFEQNQAQTIRDAIPSPLAVMNVVRSGGWKQALVSVVYLAVDSISSYYSSKSASELAYLQDDWELSDEEMEILNDGHGETLEYIWEIIHDYDLPDELALNDDDIDRFVQYKAEDNLPSRIQFFESNRDVYQAFGEYWLTLAESYYENRDMRKCLSAIESYETYSTRIFKKDYHYAKVLPLAITAASEICSDEEYVAKAAYYAERIVKNCDQEDWVLRYFAAETYVELAGMTGNSDYLNKAYDIALNNVNYLARLQESNNQEYTEELTPVKIPKDATKSKKAEIEAYNKGKTEARKTALPPISDALVLNFDLLFSLAAQIDINEDKRSTITGILEDHGESVFLNPYLAALYSFDGLSATATNDISISFDGKEIKIPARYLTAESSITIGGLDAAGKAFSLDGWQITSVERNNTTDIDTFVATLSNLHAADIQYTPGTTVWINLTPYREDHTPTVQFLYTVQKITNFLVPHLNFVRIDG